MRRTEALDRITEIAAEQSGYLTTAQAERLGVDRTRLAALASGGDLRRVRQGVYAARGIQHAFEPEIAAWLSFERGRLPWERPKRSPSAVLSHRSAATIWNLGTLIPELPALTVPRRLSSRGRGIEIHTARLGREDWTWERLDGGIRVPVTTPARTILDLAVAGEEPSYVERALREADERGLASAADLRTSAARRPRTGPAVRAWLATLDAAA